MLRKSLITNKFAKPLLGFLANVSSRIIESNKFIAYIQKLLFVSRAENLNYAVQKILHLEESQKIKILEPHFESLASIPIIQNYSIYMRRIEINNYICKIFNSTIQFGIFKNMKLLPSLYWGDTDKASMILGFYEKEVQINLKKY